MAPSFLPPQPGAIDVAPQLHSRIHQRIELFEEILHTLEMGYSRENLLYACAVLHHFLASLRYLRPYRAAPRREAGRRGRARRHSHRSHPLHEGEHRRRLTLEDMAARLGYTPTYFASLFSQRTGYAPIAYFNQLKVQEACALLDFTDMRVNQVCYKIGIADPYYFSRLFTKIMGMSPRAYKQQKKG